MYYVDQDKYENNNQLSTGLNTERRGPDTSV